MTNLEKQTALLNKLSINDIVEFLKANVNNYLEDVELVFNLFLNELEARLSKSEFLEFCNNLY